MVARFTGGPDPVVQGDLAYSAMGAYANQLGVLVTHGTADTTVAVVNGGQVISQVRSHTLM
jgi:hypothetical protein